MATGTVRRVVERRDRRWGGSWMCVLALVAVACAKDDGQIAQRLASLPPTPAEHRTGEQLFERNCAGCHGSKGGGSAQGPPLVHRVYEPSHHSDDAFFLAARNGVAAHHWRFGNMPAQPQVSRSEMVSIVAYVRWLQRQAGVY
jgi:mono/diheme cytochrome c family protein